MDDKKFDYKLLPVLMAMLQHRNTYRAAEALGTSQPAVSRALARLRVQLDDPLFVRVSGEFALTSKAEELRQGLPPLLGKLDQLLQGGKFEPRSYANPLRLALAGSLTRSHGAKIYRAIKAQTQVPVVDIENFHVHTLLRLIQGEVQCAVSYHLTAVPPELFQRPLGRVSMCLACRKGLFPPGTRFQLTDLPKYQLATLMTPLMSVPIELAEPIIENMNVAFRCSEVGPILEMLERTDFLFPLPYYETMRLNSERFDAMLVYDGEQSITMTLSLISHRKHMGREELNWIHSVIQRCLSDLLLQ